MQFSLCSTTFTSEKMATTTGEIVQEVLENSKKQFKSITVEKDIELEIDCGNLLACDSNPVEAKEYRQNKQEFLKALTRDNVQGLLNEIWKLPIERSDDVIVAQLPEPTTQIPREKPVPRQRGATRWEEYARLKGINKRKKDKKVWDDEIKDWVPAYGYKSKNDPKRDWLLEVPDNADPYEDQFGKKSEAKKERVAKNELQRLRNIARAQKKKIPGEGLAPTTTPTKAEVNKAIHLAKKSTASIGKFENKLPKEPEQRNTGKKRKFEPVLGSLQKERDSQKNILNNILTKKPRIDVTKATNQAINEGGITDPDEEAKKAKRKGKGSHRALPRTGKKRQGSSKKSYRK